MPAATDMQPFPAGFRTQNTPTNGTTLHVRVGGQGPAALLLHGYGETGDMWAPMAVDLARDHTVVVPDLRGMGLSARPEGGPEGGYDKKTQGHDVAGLLDALGIGATDLVTHDIGNMVGYAFAAQYRSRVTRFVIMDAPLPGIGPWEEVLKNPLLWHFRFGGPDMERLVAGRERIYLDRFWNEFSADPRRFGEVSREHYAKLYAQPGAMQAGFSQFAAFDQDARRQPDLPRRGQAHDAGAGGRWREVVRSDHGARHARRRDGCRGAGDPGCRALADGGATGRHGRRRARLPRPAALTVANASAVGWDRSPQPHNWKRRRR